jgi:hypothetical protein
MIMVDLEGTLTDNSKRLATLLAITRMDRKNQNAWKIYYAGLPDDPPREVVLRYVRTAIQQGERPLIFSTRFANKYRHEEEWLRAHELWEHVELLQRDNTETKIEGPSLVVKWVQEFEPSVFIDDRPEVRQKVQGLVPGMLILDPAELQTSFLPMPIKEPTAMVNFVDSTSDERLVNNVVPPSPERNNAMRHAYRVLNDEQKVQMQSIKDRCLELWEYIDSLGSSRELSLAKTAVEDACMRTVRHITE